MNYEKQQSNEMLYSELSVQKRQNSKSFKNLLKDTINEHNYENWEPNDQFLEDQKSTQTIFRTRGNEIKIYFGFKNTKQGNFI